MRFLIILSIIAYLLYKIGGFFFKAGAASQQYRQTPPKQNSNVKPDSAPGKRNGSIKGGEYVDYEEVK
jgi:hypothetical protein